MITTRTRSGPRYALVCELRQGPQGAQEGLLGQVLSLGRITGVPGERPVHGPPAALAQRIDRRTWPAKAGRTRLAPADRDQ